MTETDRLRAGKLAAVVNAGMAVRIDQDDVMRRLSERRDCAEIGLVAGRKHDAVLVAQKIGEIFFKLFVPGICAIGEARARRAGAGHFHRIRGGFYRGFVKGEPQIIVCPGKDDLLALHHGAGRAVHLVHRDGERIARRLLQQALQKTRLVLEFVKKAHGYACSFLIS